MYPSLQEQEERGLDGPVYRAFRAAVGEADGGVVQGLVVGSYGDTSAAVDALAGEAADDMAGRHWRLMGARSQAEARGIFMQYVRRRWSATFTGAHGARCCTRACRASGSRRAACCA